MHPVFSEWKAAVDALSRIELVLEAAIRTEFSVEKMAFFEVFGAGTTRPNANIYSDRISFYQIDDDGQLEAWAYGSYGGDNNIVWERRLVGKTGDELYQHFVDQFRLIDNHEKEMARQSKDARRAKLMAELAELNKEIV